MVDEEAILPLTLSEVIEYAHSIIRGYSMARLVYQHAYGLCEHLDRHAQVSSRGYVRRALNCTVYQAKGWWLS